MGTYKGTGLEEWKRTHAGHAQAKWDGVGGVKAFRGPKWA